MIRKNKFLVLIFFFIIFTSYNFNEQKQNNSIFFPIKEVVIENTFAVDLVKLSIELEFLKNTSLFFLKKKKIAKIVDKYDFISASWIFFLIAIDSY